jgi:hypothetical protein
MILQSIRCESLAGNHIKSFTDEALGAKVVIRIL